MDRKAWIIVTLCGMLLALGMYQSSQNAKLLRQQHLAEEKQKTAEKTAAAPSNPLPTASVEKRTIPKEVGSEESHQITTATNNFTLSSLEGGIEKTEFLEEKSVHGNGTNVTMNDLGRNRIGALTRLSGDSLEKGYYKISSQDKDSVTFEGETKNNLQVTKTWTRVNDGPGKDHRLTFTLKLSNPTTGEISLSDLAIFSGSAAPVHLNERPNYLNFFWNENGEFDSETSGYFSSFFGADPTEFRQLIASTNFIGVENQFFATIISPQEAYPATFRAIQKTVGGQGNYGGCAPWRGRRKTCPHALSDHFSSGAARGLGGDDAAYGAYSSIALAFAITRRADCGRSEIYDRSAAARGARAKAASPCAIAQPAAR